MTGTQGFLNSVVKHGFVTETECREMLARYQGNAFDLLIVLLRREPRRRGELGRLWGDSIETAYVDLGRTLIQYDLVKRLPEEVMRHNGVIPIYEFGEVLTVATSKPGDKALIRQMEDMLGTFVSPVFAFPDQVDSALEIAFQSNTALTQLLDKELAVISQRTDAIDAEELKWLSEDQAIVRFTRGLMLLAVKRRASDIHLEPGVREVRIRFRIDGMLQEVFSIQSALYPAIVTRLKVLAEADIAESRRPQEGRMQLTLPDRVIEFRFSCMPVLYGEKIVMRILGHSQFAEVPDLVELDFSRTVTLNIRKVTESPHGLFFITGPTGSGKTTTLYALLKFMSHPGINIVTIEDPVEYTLEGINQTQVSEILGLNFPAALRFLLRQDPDVILVGEIRDFETASVATRSALTGHLVLTTLHTNNAIQAITRLLDLGVDPTMVASSVIGLMGQRLVRRLCDHCKDRYQPPKEILDSLFEWEGQEAPHFHRIRGCERCNFTGYFGRIAIHELFMADDPFRSLVAARATSQELLAHAMSHGYRNLRYDGIKKVLRGLTTLEEINRVAAEDL